MELLGQTKDAKAIGGSLSTKLLERYMSYPAIGYEMGFAAITRKDFQDGYSFTEAFGRLLKRTAAFEMCGTGYVPREVKDMKFTPSQYALAWLTLARWLPICAIQATGIHEPFVKMSLDKRPLVRAAGRVAMMTLGEGLYWLGYAVAPGFCQDMNPNLPVGLEKDVTLQEVAGQSAVRDIWREA